MDKDKRKSFVFYRDWYDTICKLDEKTGFELSKAIMAIAFGEEPQNISSITEAMLMLVRPQIERDIDKWLEIKEKRQESGKMGGLAKQANATKSKQMIPNATKSKQMIPNATKSKQMIPNATKSKQMIPNATKSKQNVASVGVNVDVDVNVDNNSVVLEEKDSKEKESDFIERMYKLYPTKCPIRDISTAKCSKDKKRIGSLLNRYSMEEIENVIKKEIKDKLGKHPLKNFSTFLNNFPDPNDVFSTQNLGYPTSIDDVKDDDIVANIEHLKYVMFEKKFPKIYNNLRGLPNTQNEFDRMVRVTVGGLRGVTYAMLVLERDGWEKYDDPSGFMWIYANFIKANGLYKE